MTKEDSKRLGVKRCASNRAASRTLLRMRPFRARKSCGHHDGFEPDDFYRRKRIDFGIPEVMVASRAQLRET